MATINSAGSGDWSVGATWVGGVAPAGGSLGDDAVILKNHAVTLDGITNACKSLVLNVGTATTDVGGKLLCKTDRDTKLASYNGIVANGSTGGATYGAYSSEVVLDMSGAPTYKCEIVPNGAAIVTDVAAVQLKGKFTIKGAARQRWSFTTAVLTSGVTSVINIANVTGWRAGDKLVFATTQAYNASPKYSEAVISSIGAITGTAADVTLTAAITNSHDSGCLVGNFQSNMRFFPPVDYNFCSVEVRPLLNSAGTLSNVEFYKCLGDSSSFGADGVLNLQPGAFTGATVDACAFYQFKSQAVFSYASDGGVARSNCQYFTTQAASLVFSVQSPIGGLGDESDMCVYAATPTSTNGAVSLSGAGLRIVRPNISGVTGNAAFSNVNGYGDARVVGGGVWSCLAVDQRPNVQSATMYFDGTYLGKGVEGHVYASANNANISKIAGSGNAIYTSCPENLSGGGRADAVAGAVTSETAFYNRNNDAANQDVYRIKISASAPVFVRDAAVANRANASMRVDTLGSATTFERTFDLLVKAGEAATIFVYARKNAAFNDGTNTRPTATLSGLGITPITATMTDVDDTWERLDISYAAGAAPSADGNLTLTLSCQSSTAGAKAYFSGIPIPPFVTRCRHYGYLFDETTPTRTTNITIDSGISEATALAYGNSGTDLDVTWGATSSLAVKVDSTFKKIYHFTQADACLNISSALPLTGAGVDDSPALFAAGNVTVSATKTLNGSGSLEMGAYTLTGTMPWAYTYTGGTFSQSAAEPSFSGGTLNIGAAGTYTFTQAASMTVSATPTAPSNYVLSAATFTGTLNFRNTSAHNITVEIPSGVTANSTGSPGAGTVTFVAPVVTADISITGMSNTTGANNRLQIINQTAVAAADWQAAHAYAAGDIVLRTSGIGSENTAGLYMRCTTAGTSGASEPTWDTTVGDTTADGAGTLVWTTYAILYYDADPAATSLTDTYIDGEEFLAGETVEIRFAEEDPAVSFKTYSTSVVTTSEGFSALANSTSDSVYATYALSGAAYDTTYSPNYVASYMVLDTNTNFTGASSFAYYCYLLTTSEGMYRFWGGLTALDAGNVRNNVDVLDLFFDETAGFVRQTDDVRIFKSDGTRPALDPTTGGAGIEINWKVPVNVVTTGGSAVLPQDIIDIADAVAVVAVDGSTTLAESLRLSNSVLGGKVSGAGTGTETFRDLADTKNRVVSTVDDDGNRTAVTRDLT